MYITSVIALLGAVVATYLGLPLGAMFGAAIVVMVAGKCNVSLSLSRHTITFVQLVLGITVGTMVPAGALNSGFPIMFLVGLICCMSGQVLASFLWLHKKEHWSKVDSLLGSVPGAMAAVLVINETQKSPSSKVIFTHTIRLVCLVVLSGLIVSGDIQPESKSILNIQSLLLLLPLGSAFIFGVVLEKMGTPAPYMVTGMVTTIALGIIIPEKSFVVPSEAIFVASSALGALIGIRLKDITLAEFITHMRAGIIATALSLLVTILCAYGFSHIIDKGFTVLLMSWVPGSIEAMTVAAISLGLEPALIMFSHIIRMVILHSIPLCFSLYSRARKISKMTAPD